MFSKKPTARSVFLSGMVIAAMLGALCVTSCGGDGGGGKSSTAGVTDPVLPITPPPPPPPVVVTMPITQVANDLANPGQVIMTSANTLTAGAFIVVSGSTVPAYNGTYAVVSATATTFTVAAVFAGNATAVWQSGGGSLAGCVSTGATAAITLSYSPSRLTGAAPFGVFFDATATTATTTTRPFQDLEYKWTFGDATSGSWGAGSRAGSSSRNTASGAVSAHVFESPGTYIVNLTVTDGTNVVSNSCVQIAVLDPNVIFSGSNTICVGATTDPVPGGVDGCPTGAAHQIQPNFNTIVSTYLGTGKRVLLKHDDTFVTTSPTSVLQNGPWHIGIYGSGAKPVILNTAGAALSGSLFGWFWPGNPSFGDGRVVDLVFDGGNSGNTFGIGGGSSSSQILILRSDIRNAGTGISLDDFGQTRIFDTVFVADSTINNMAFGVGHGIYGSAIRSAIIGNVITNSSGGGGTGMRLFGLRKSLISNNTIGNTLNDNIKIHGLDWLTTGIYSEQFIVADNRLQGGATLVLWIQQQNGFGTEERLRNFVVERNWFTSTPIQSTAIVVTAQDGTVRNNLFDLSGGSGGAMSAGGATACCATSNDLRFFNNTVYSSAGSVGAGLTLQSGVLNIVARNNLFYSPSAPGATVVSNLGSASTLDHNTGDIGSVVTDPKFVSVTPINPTNARITSGSYAIGSGATVPVWSDLLVAPNVSPPDIGAVNH